jgi:hypothetical protein
VRLHESVGGGEAETFEVILPCIDLHAEDADSSEDSDGDSDSDCERESAPLSPAAVRHLCPLLLLLRPFLQSGAVRELEAIKAWFAVLFRVLLHTGNSRHSGKKFMANFLEAGSSAGTAGSSPAEAVAACIEALMACVPHDAWPSVCKELCDQVISYVPSQEEKRALQEEDLVLCALRRRWPVSPRAAELHRQIVEAKLLELLPPGKTSDDAPSDGAGLPHAALDAEKVRGLLRQVSLRPPADRLLGHGANTKKPVVYVNEVATSAEEFSRILHYLRLVLQKIISARGPGAAAFLKEIYSDITSWESQIKGALQCRVLLQNILELIHKCKGRSQLASAY